MEEEGLKEGMGNMGRGVGRRIWFGESGGEEVGMEVRRGLVEGRWG